MRTLAGVLGFCSVLFSAHAQDALRQDFANPPSSARPRVWWHWMNGNVTKEGIKLDLEWMKRAGIGGLQNFDASLATPKVVDKRLAYMTPEWKDAFRYAAQLATDLGLEMAIASSPGWSETGGPWVKPEQGMKKLVWSELRVHGGTRLAGQLPRPPATTGAFQSVPHHEDFATPGAPAPPQYYADAVVVAYRVPPGWALPANRTASVSSSAGAVSAAALADGDLIKSVKVPIGRDGAWLLYDYGAPQTIYAVTVARPVAAMFMPSVPIDMRLEASEDGHTFRAVTDLPPSRVAQHTVSFPPVAARYFRLTIQKGTAATSVGGFEPAPGADPGFFAAMGAAAMAKNDAEVNEFVLHTSPRVNRWEEKAGFGLVPDYYAIATPPIDAKMAVAATDVVDLTSRMKPDGSLEWTPPAGEWNIVRFGYSLTGTTNHPATPEATGLEVDKLDASAVKSYIDAYLRSYEETLGPELMGRRGVTALLTDSIEVGPYNWTPGMIGDFKRLRGYDPTPYSPALTGVVVGSAEQSDRFLWDFRRTLAELTAQSHYGQIAKSAHERGLTYYGESLEGTRVSIGDDMEMRQNADIPMAAMWTYPPASGPRSNYVVDILGAASVSHIYGRQLVAAESMTSALVPWGFSPRILRPIIDLEFALGVNRPVIHTSVHQPLVDKKPGLSLMIFGQYFNRNETWAEQARPWVDYIARTAYMLQQGKFAADVAYFYGEEAPLSGLYGEGSALPKDLPQGYGFDFVNSDALLHQISFANGGLETPSGMHYRVLYLGGSSSRMTLPVLRKIRDLVDAGAVIVGERPTGSPSLADDAAEFAKIAGALWGGNTGQGKIVAGKNAASALAKLGIARDFDSGRDDGEIMFNHRHAGAGEIYFLSNRADRKQTVDAAFRVTGKVPQLWHADTGNVEPVSYRSENGRTVLPLELEPNASVFVVFRESTAMPNFTVQRPADTILATIDGKWEVGFDPAYGGPGNAEFDRLVSWSENSDPGVKYYSGTATYRKSIDVPADWTAAGQRMVLDLGDVRELAEVVVNGRSLGVAWHPPYKVDVTRALKPGANTIELRVTNLWVNRLIGDVQPGAKKYTFNAAPAYKADAPLRPSGLLGPVRVIKVSSRP